MPREKATTVYNVLAIVLSHRTMWCMDFLGKISMIVSSCSFSMSRRLF